MRTSESELSEGRWMVRGPLGLLVSDSGKKKRLVSSSRGLRANEEVNDNNSAQRKTVKEVGTTAIAMVGSNFKLKMVMEMR